MRKSLHKLLFFLFLIIVGLHVACTPEKGGDTADQSADKTTEPAIERVTERGPVKVTVQVDKETLTIADRIELTLLVERDEGYEVRLPRFGEKLEQFGIVDFMDIQDSLNEDGRVVSGRRYELEPFLSGDYVVPPMEIEFWKLDDTDKKHQLETEAIELKVNSVLEGDDVRTEIHDIMGPMELAPPPSKFKWWYVLIVVLILGAVVWAIMARRKTDETRVVIRRPAHEIAFERLTQLGEAGHAQKGEFKIFFQLISDILRHYIEDRYGLRATDQTTEEFLFAIRDASYLATGQKETLKEFMNLSDLVKFAEHTPTDEDIQSAFDRCRDLINATQQKVTPPSVSQD
ncbi:DUF4381 family protein [Verrucomicrobia bacterium]|nr:DUF4381 family protein [Verrucomicrobiota bacterium]